MIAVADISSPHANRRRQLFVVGYPGDVGGANTECWHTIRLWRRFGLDVTLLPTWRADPAWRTRLDAIGCRTIEVAPEELAKVPRLNGGVVVSFCNSHFLREAARFQALDCRIIWLGCMNWLLSHERKHYASHKPFDAYIFQSHYQHSELQPQLAKFGVRAEQCHHVRGALAWDEFSFEPLAHRVGEPPVIGRISRAAPDKHARHTWSIYQRIGGPIRARLMAWDRGVQERLGPPPDWAECLPAGAETSCEFLGKLHVMLQINGGATENWPRSGLEAMARGVPIVAQNRWGWREMIRHGETGYLADSDDGLAQYASRLARDESCRQEMARRARRVLEEELAHPEVLWSGWRKVLESL